MKLPSNRQTKRPPRHISKIIEQIYDHLGPKQKQNGNPLNEIWKKVAGERIAQHSKPIKVNHGKLWVYIESAAWMNELTFLKEKIKIEAKNEFLKYGITVEDIIFKSGKIHDDLKS